MKVKHSHPEQGAAIIMALFVITMFLFMTILFLDVPYMERIGRSMQRTVDAAALAGSTQLTRKSTITDDADRDFTTQPACPPPPPPQNTPLPGAPIPPPPTPLPAPVACQPMEPLPSLEDTALHLHGWRAAKRAVFATLNANPIAGVNGLIFTPLAPAPLVPADPLDLVGSPYAYENYTGTVGIYTYNLSITRGVYERPRSVAPFNNTLFYPGELGDPIRQTWFGPTQTNESCNILSYDGVNRRWITWGGAPFEIVDYVAVPLACKDLLPIFDVADSVSVTLTISGVPTLFAKLVGFPSYSSITRTAVSVPQ